MGDGWESTGGNKMGVENECVWEGCKVEGCVCGREGECGMMMIGWC